MKNETKLSHTGWRLLEVLLFCAALGFVIPPFSSTETSYRPWAAMIIGGVLFALHAGIKIVRKEEGIVSASMKTIAYLAAIFVAYERIRGS